MNPRNDELYQSKQKRDVRANWLRLEGYVVKKYSVRNQQLHPMYVEDLKDTVEGRDRGFGNTVYKTYFAVLYGVRWEEKPERESQISKHCDSGVMNDMRFGDGPDY